MNPCLSIITINYNNVDGLKKTIDSVIRQSYNDFEWIVIDGGSTDGSVGIIEQYAQYISYWVSEPDKGIYNAMNKGIDVASGEYLLFLNSGDCFYGDRVLEECFPIEHKADIVYGDMAFSYGDHVVVHRYPDNLSFKFFLNNSLGHPSSFIKRSLLKEEHYNEQLRIASDLEFWFKTALSNGSFRHLDKVVSVFDTTGISSTNQELDREERQILISKYVPRMVLDDYDQLLQLEKDMDDIQVKEVMKYGHKKRVYHKIITLSLLVVRFIDSFFTK